MVRISYGSCEVILAEDLGVKSASAKFVLQPQTLEQKESCLSWLLIFCNVQKPVKTSKNIITGDQIWVYGHGPELKH
jgi:hypothetical protein